MTSLENYSPGAAFTKALRASFAEAAVPARYVWEVALQDAHFIETTISTSASWSAATFTYNFYLNGSLFQGPTSDVRGNLTSTAGSLVQGLGAPGDLLKFELVSTDTTAAAGTGYFELVFIPVTRLAADSTIVTPL